MVQVDFVESERSKRNKGRVVLVVDSDWWLLVTSVNRRLTDGTYRPYCILVTYKSFSRVNIINTRNTKHH
jgi:hypothetical protein